MANRNSPSGSDFSPFSQAGKPPTLLPAVSVSGSEVPSVSRVVNVSASRRSTQLASVDSTLSAMLAGALHKGKANAAGTNLKRQRTTPPTNVVSSTNPYGSSTQSSQMGNGIYYASDLKRQKLVDGLQHYVESSSDLYGSSNARRFWCG